MVLSWIGFYLSNFIRPEGIVEYMEEYKAYQGRLRFGFMQTN